MKTAEYSLWDQSYDKFSIAEDMPTQSTVDTTIILSSRTEVFT